MGPQSVDFDGFCSFWDETDSYQMFDGKRMAYLDSAHFFASDGRIRFVLVKILGNFSSSRKSKKSTRTVDHEGSKK